MAAWEFLPQIPLLSQNTRFLDSFFISSPHDVVNSLVILATGGSNSNVTMWPSLLVTIQETLVGSAIGLVTGAVVGLLFSNNPRLGEVMNPLIVVGNSVPRVALIPIFVVIAGPTLAASILSIVAVVFFLAFFNALEGGRSVRPVVLENVTLLGATQLQIMRVVRLPMVLIWTFAAIPNVISFALIVAVTTEWFAGIPGMGSLLATATQNLQVGRTFAIIVVLCAVGLVLNFLASVVQRRAIRWQT
jgi:NitT/TauT family transport system permease protein